ncbi:lytic transglycosylase domain-containing protein [Sphaerimonospora thailandensis]|uniref:lytic transglycosylase domain-containing protein n=1 Tax=Sphaerimonospora thailandensis TaxID=795644 RepID=UPI001EF2CB7D|nr:lytic transglycosylase domain-containing protein [Sphaerimonospora thailandensis]
MRHLPGSVPLRTFVAGLAVAIAGVIVMGSLFLVTEGGAGAAERSPSRAPAPAPTLRPEAALVPDASLPSSRPVVAVPAETAETASTGGTAGTDIRVTPPSLMAIAQSKVTARTLREMAKLPHVTKAAAVDGGSVRVSGTALRLLAVDPARFRQWTPKAVARHPEVWRALAGDEFVADRAAAKRLSLVLGAEYQLDGGPRLRLAASAALGLPGIDGLIGKDLGRRLGFAEGIVVLVHGEDGLIDRNGVKRLLGGTAEIVPVTSSSGGGRTPSRTSEGLVGRPESYLELYQRSAELCPGLSWTVLAAIGQVESGHGRNNGPSSAGALGPMQFMPATWKAYGVDGDGDGETDIWSAYDAVPSAATYLCANGAGRGGEKLRKAVWFYNHSWAYVDRVLSLADAYARTYS